MSPSRAGHGRAAPTAAAGSTRRGQCHRYSEYEMPPTQRIGRTANRRDSRVAGLRAARRAITSAAPHDRDEGGRPGNGVPRSNDDGPEPDEQQAERRPRRAPRPSAVAPPGRPRAPVIAPTASSQARAGSRKNANGASVDVQAMPIAERDDGDDRRRPARSRRRSDAPRGDEQEERRPHQVELLLDAERPEVQERRRGQLCLEVVGRLRRRSGCCSRTARPRRHRARRHRPSAAAAGRSRRRPP